MVLSGLPDATKSYLFHDAIARDPVTARRTLLTRALVRERYLTRESLMLRVESQMGYACFGEKSWEDNFFRDMRVVKVALERSGIQVKYSRSKDQPGYYFAGEGTLHSDVKVEIAGAIQEIDDEQINVYKRLSPAKKFFQACSITNLARRVSMSASGYGG